MHSILSCLSYLYYPLILLAILAAITVSFIILIVSIQWSRTNEAPADLPWAGLQDKKFLPKVRANIREVAAGRGPLEEGYEKYSKNGQAFVLPALHWPDVALPPTNIPWLASQPENVLSGVKPQNEILLLDVLAHGPDLAACFDFTVISRDLTRQTIHVLGDILDEMKVSFDEQLPSDMEDWKDIKMYESIAAVSRRISNRLFVGLPLCRDERYIRGLARWEFAFGICSAVIRYLIPGAMLRSYFAPVVALPVHAMRWWLSRMILPIMRRRRATQLRISDEKSDFKPPNDALQWIMDGTARKGGTQGMTEYDIAGKTILFNFFAVHTTSMTTDSILTDILCHPEAESLIAELREEADTIMPRLASDPRAVREMNKFDSVIRESMRLNPLMGRGLQREVVQPGGVTTPDGQYLPKGTHVCAPLSSRERDAEVWDRPDEFVPLRFYKSAEDLNGSEDEKQWSAVHATESFLSFGLGRHACPGRFFAVQTLKLFLAYLFVNYDFEPLAERPKTLSIGETFLQKMETTIKVRRRKTVENAMGDWS